MVVAREHPHRDWTRNREPRMIPLNDLLADCRQMHSDLQMDAFITVRSGGTLFGCYAQALRELNTRTRALRSQYSGMANMLVDIDVWETGEAKTQYDRRRNKIKAAEHRHALDECRRSIAETEYEFLRFYRQAISLRDALESRGVTFPLDNETRDRLDREMWEHNIKSMAAVDFMTTGRLAPNTIGLLQALPAEMRRRVAETILSGDDKAPLIDWFLTHEPEMPDPARIEMQDVRRLIGCELSPS
jgi:hypothetical protein